MDIIATLTRKQYRQLIGLEPIRPVEEQDPWASDREVAKHDAHNRWAA